MPAPPAAEVYFISPQNGATVHGPVTVRFGLKGMGIAPAGVKFDNTGHHHLLIDTALSPDELTQPITVDEKHIHFGKGQTETMVTLPPGKHTLQLELGDWTHIPFNKPVQSEVISITVKGATAANAPADAKAKLMKPEHHHHTHHQHRHRYYK